MTKYDNRTDVIVDEDGNEYDSIQSDFESYELKAIKELKIKKDIKKQYHYNH